MSTFIRGFMAGWSGLCWTAAALATALALSTFAVALRSSVAAAATVYSFGYVVGALLVEPAACTTRSLGVVRLVSGLLLTTIGYLLSLEASLPWWCGPGTLLIVAVARNKRAAFGPLPAVSVSGSDALAAGVGALLFGPTLVSAFLMTPGDYPPVFFNVDTPYFLEKVHALVGSDIYPPPSLGMLGGRLAYHFGIHGLAGFVSKASGLSVHHSSFLIVVPLLVTGVVSAALFCARAVAPRIPTAFIATMLLVGVPAVPLWDSVGRRIVDAISSRTLTPLQISLADYELWNVAFNNAHNIAAHFLVLASLGAVVNASEIGWRLGIFLVGSAVIFKAPTGIALVAGLMAAQSVRAVREMQLRPLLPAVAGVAVCGGVYWAFWVLPLPADYHFAPHPFYFLRYVHERGGLLGCGLDAAWLFAPALVVTAAPERSGRRATSLLAFAFAPFLIVNTFQAVSVRPIANVDEDWFQILLPVPFLLRAFAASLAEARWTRLTRGQRMLFLGIVVLSVLPPAIVSARYAVQLMVHPEQGHEYVDNHALAEALTAIPVRGSVIVTNDLRYPAEGFRRDDRQMQIPAIFGHQAYAVNYSYEVYPFSETRHELQALLRATTWTEAIDTAAQNQLWTHFLVRKDYPHPAVIPLEHLFGNDKYVVYAFSKGVSH